MQINAVVSEFNWLKDAVEMEVLIIYCEFQKNISVVF